MTKDQKIEEEIKELVITRIEAQLPSHLKLSIGSSGSMTKEEMIEHIKKGDEVGQKIINSHMAFLKALVNGELVKAITSV